jgi:selenocysteine-specific elongation factor
MFIVATAGHIDHGKTALVRALTGVDTDRLPQERARGISIDLGFAYWEPEPGALVAFVDVPGHQRFIRNMLAGVAAIEFALLVVAVDDGPMPQTVEHLHILDQLGIREGAVVLSKADLADDVRVREVGAAVSALLSGTSMAGSPAFAVSARSGAGIAELLAHLRERARHRAVDARAQRQARRARFAVDRVFTIKGAGTIATGTVFNGTVGRDDKLQSYPGGDVMRVRSLQVHGREVERVSSGMRAALNVAGVAATDLARGCWLVDPAAGQAPSQLMDVRISLLPDAAPLRHASRTFLYLGPSETTCRVLLPRGATVEPGAKVLARLHLEQPLLAVNADRFVLRDLGAGATLGGGVVLDPAPASRRRWLSTAELQALEAGGVRPVLEAMLVAQAATGVSLAHFERIFLLAAAERDEALAACGAVVLGKTRPVAVSTSQCEQWEQAAGAALARDTRTAVPLSALRQTVSPQLPMEAFESLLRSAAGRLDLSVAAGAVSLRSRRDGVRSEDQAAWERVHPLLAQAGLDPPDLATLASASGVPAARLRVILYARTRTGDVLPLRPDRYIVRELAAGLAATAALTARSHEQGRFTAAQFRDEVGTGRTLAIHVLEMLDLAGVTRRIGDQRTIARAPEAVLGSAQPIRLGAPATRKR